jgi:hypothetical protein
VINRAIPGISSEELLNFYPIISDWIRERNTNRLDRKDADTLKLKKAKSIASSDIAQIVKFSVIFSEIIRERIQSAPFHNTSIL